MNFLVKFVIYNYAVPSSTNESYDFFPGTKNRAKREPPIGSIHNTTSFSNRSISDLSKIL